MDGARARELQDDEEREGTLDSAIRSVARGERIDTHTCTPGIIKSYDAVTQTAKVQPAIRRLFVERGFINLPECVDVPVQFPRAGNFIITFPVAAGDECLLQFGERAIDFWWDRGGVQEPSEPRLHDLSDAFAALGYSSKPKAAQVVGGAAPDALEIRTLDGANVIRLKDGTVELGAVSGTPLVPLLDGVVHGRGIDPFTGTPYYALGSTSSIVMAKK